MTDLRVREYFPNGDIYYKLLHNEDFKKIEIRQV